MGDTGRVPRPLVSVFAVEDTAVQVVWRTLPATEVCLQAGDSGVRVTATSPAWLRRKGCPPRRLANVSGAVGGPGAVVIGGLTPATRYSLTLTGKDVPRRVVTRFTTLPSPSGRLLCRFGTINDIHIGERRFGVLGAIEDMSPLPAEWETYTLRCARAAIAEMLEWGAQAIVVKGDLTRDGEPVEVREAAKLFTGLPVPIEVILGNHEHHDRHTDARALLAACGIDVPREPWSRDLPGIRLILGHSPIPGHKAGAIDASQRARIVALAGDAPAAAFVALHHQPQRWRIPNQYPPGIPGPQAAALLDALAATNPATVLASGHTHRHRRHRHGPLVAVETGSTKDYPGTWAGYAVHEEGIRQVVRRIGAPEVIGWTEGTYWALGGVWGKWSPGPLSQRCFTHDWPAG
jgi:3',5'-cyclic-AMP phosphodiesterase